MRVVAVAAGSRHSLVLADGGAVYSFGDDTGGQLGQGYDELGGGRMLWTPTRVRALDTLDALSEAPCSGDSDAISTASQHPLACYQPRRRRRVIAVAAGEAHSLCLLEGGVQVVSWGSGGGLGLETSVLSDQAADQPLSWGSAGNYEWAPGDEARRWQARVPTLLQPFA